VQIGIIGVKFTGKTTLFNVITGAGLPTGQGGVDPHLAVGKVPDPRLTRLTAMFKPKRESTPAWNGWIFPVFKLASPLMGGVRLPVFLETLAAELALADLQIVENRLEKLTKEKARMGKVANALEPPMFERFLEQLEADRPLRDLQQNPDEEKMSSGYAFLTAKPLIAVFNLEEGAEIPTEALEAAEAAGAEVVSLCATMEEELAELDPEDAREFLADLGIEEPAKNLMIRAAYGALNLQSFFTVGPDECRAWPVPRGASAPMAAGVIHSDLQRGFIRAEVTPYDDLIAAGGMAEAKAANKMSLEGKNYIVQDGDILEIRFSV